MPTEWGKRSKYVIGLWWRKITEIKQEKGFAWIDDERKPEIEEYCTQHSLSKVQKENNNKTKTRSVPHKPMRLSEDLEQ